MSARAEQEGKSELEEKDGQAVQVQEEQEERKKVEEDGQAVQMHCHQSCRWMREVRLTCTFTFSPPPFPPFTHLCTWSYMRQCGLLSSRRVQSSGVMVCRHLWLRRSHTLIVLSPDMEKTWFSRSSRARWVTLAVWPLSSPTRRQVWP